jgi:Domain of unknown function (DUF6379)
MKSVFSGFLISGPGTRVNGSVLTLEVRLPWYRSLPLSVARVSEICIDGKAISLAGAEVEANGKRFPLADLADKTTDFWFVLDSILVHVPIAKLDPAQPHEADLLLHIYPPYIPMLTWVTRGSAPLAVHSH